MTIELRHRVIPVGPGGPRGQVRLHAVEAGPLDGPLVILLHGFPDLGYGWHHQIEPLAAAGWRVLVPNQRGYGASDKPPGTRSYRLDRLAADVVDLIDEAGRDRASIVGHDWGAAVGWWLGMTHADRLDRLALLNMPHPFLFRRHLLRDPVQRRKSWYIFFYQLPFLPEIYLRRHHWSTLTRALTATSRPGTFSATDLAIYLAAWKQPGAVTAMLSWYRAGLRHPPARPPSWRVTVPTLLLWGTRDRFLRQELAAASLDFCDRGQLSLLPTTHWAQHEAPDEVTRHLLSFLP